MIQRLRPANPSMADLGRLVWPEGIAITSQGLRIGVRVSARGHCDRIRKVLPPGSSPTSSSSVQRLYSVVVPRPSQRGGKRPHHLVYAQADLIARSRDLEDVLRSLESHLQLYVAEHSRSRVFLHAGVVAWQGRAIVMPGRSYSGKSTLVAALVKAGATYYSDEYAPIDARCRVHAYTVPLRLRPRAGELPKRVIPTSCDPALPPLPVGLIVATAYARGARWHHRTLTPGRAALEVLRHAVPARRTPERVMDRLSRLTASAPLVQGRRGPATEAARRVLALATR
jgi:hypothetical protein